MWPIAFSFSQQRSVAPARSMRDRVGQPLVVHARRVDGRAHVMPNSVTSSTTLKTVLMIVRPPGEPVMSTTLPSSTTIVGVIELSMRLPGAIRFGGVPIVPVVRR